MSLPSLSGSDYFHLLLDRKMLRNGLVGNISRIHLELDATADLNQLEERLAQNKTLLEVAKLRYAQRWPFLPKWEVRDCHSRSSFAMTKDRASLRGTKQSLRIHENISKSQFEAVVLNRKVDNENGLVFIDLCALEDGSKHVVISMHHVLFDHQGMMNFVHALANETVKFPLFPEPKRTGFLKSFANFWYMTVYMLSRSSWKLGTLVNKNVKPRSAPRYRIIEFGKDETQQIERNAWSAGARIGQSAFYISATAQTVAKTITKRGENPPYLWFSVPHDQRRKGTKGHLVSNQLSFLFFKLRTNILNDTNAVVSEINAQLKVQIRKRITARYAALLDALRFMPMPIYEAMVDLASNGKTSSFGYSDLGSDKMVFEKLCGVEIEKTFHYPPVPSPPGFNVIGQKKNGQLQFIWAYFDEVLSESEIKRMEDDFRQMLW